MAAHASTAEAGPVTVAACFCHLPPPAATVQGWFCVQGLAQPSRESRGLLTLLEVSLVHELSWRGISHPKLVMDDTVAELLNHQV